MEAVGRAPVGGVVTGVRRAKARAVMARVAVGLAAAAVPVGLADVVAPVDLADVTEAAGGEIVTRARSALASGSSLS
jgi:hypothetical protein